MRYSVVIPAVFASSAFSFPHLANIGDFQVKSELVNRQEGASGSALKPKHSTWTAPGPNDVRAPCPVLNTLANHGFLPHDGRNITLDIVTPAFKDALNVGADVAAVTFNGGLRANPEPNATWLDLDMLHTHNVVEHDGSLSRKDMALDPSNKFDPETFDAYLAFYDGASDLTVEGAANARARHALDMSKINPEFSLTQAQVPVALGETAMMLWIFNGTQGTTENPAANREYFEYLFRNERLPVELGWTPLETEFNIADLQPLLTKLQAATPAGVPLTFTPAASR